MVNDSIISKLKAIAIEKHGPNISPCDPSKRGTTFDDCITVEDDRIRLWFNTPDKSTHIVSLPAKEVSYV